MSDATTTIYINSHIDDMRIKHMKLNILLQKNVQPHVEEQRKILHDLNIHLEKLGKPNKTNQKQIDDDKKLIAFHQDLLQASLHILVQAIDRVGITRVYLNKGNMDQTKFGVFDGWPGTYWIERTEQHK